MTEQNGVTIDDVRRVAELANLELTAEEEPRMQRDLNAILGHIAQLNELDTTGIPAMFPTASVAARSFSRAVSSPERARNALARSIRCGKSTFHGCGGTYGHFVMKHMSHR